MSVIVIGFIFIAFLSFAVILFAMRPSKDEKVFERRLSSLNSFDPTAGAGSAPRLAMKSDTNKESSWVEAAAERYELARKLRALIIQSDSKITFETFLLASVGLAFVGFFAAYLFLSMAAIGVLAAVLLGMVPAMWLGYKRGRRIKAFNAELSNAVDMMSNALRAGHSVIGAIGILAEQAVEPTASEFGEVFRQQNYGLPLREALMELLERVPSSDLRVVVTAILVQKDTGGNLGEILDRTVFVIRERVRIYGEIKTQTAQGRMTGWVLTLLPIALLFAINIVNPGYSNVLLYDPFGRKLTYAGIALLVMGSFVIRRLINKIEV